MRDDLCGESHFRPAAHGKHQPEDRTFMQPAHDGEIGTMHRGRDGSIPAEEG